MFQSSAEYLAPAAPRIARPVRTRTPERLVSYVSIDVTVPGHSTSAGRRALHQALGDDLRLYVVTMDKLRDCVTFRIEVTSRPLADVIAALTRTLGQATLGRAVTTQIRRPQRG
ncbi:hypothetical protein AAHK20_28325 [Trinickia sp. YCB016]